MARIELSETELKAIADEVAERLEPVLLEGLKQKLVDELQKARGHGR